MCRAILLLPLLLAACGAADPKPVERAFSWRVDEGERVTGAVALPGGGYYVNVQGEAPRGVFFSDTGRAVGVALYALCDGCVAAQPLVVGDAAFFGPAEGGEPIFTVDPAKRRVQPLLLQNPRGLPIGAFFLDGARAAAGANGGQMLLPGDRLLELSVEGIAIENHPTPAIRAVAHAQDDIYAFLSDTGSLGGFRDGDRAVTDFGLPAAALAGGDGFTVVGLVEAGTLGLRLYRDLETELAAGFHHHVALAVAPAAGVVLVGVLEQALDGAPADEKPTHPPGTILFLDGAGRRLGRHRASSPIVAVHLDASGERAIVAHEHGIHAFDLR